jgi:hypothetical protein
VGVDNTSLGPGGTPQQITMSLSQNGSALSGTWAISNFALADPLSGTKTESNVSITFLEPAISCSLSFTGTLSSLTALSGTIVNNNCFSGGSPMTFTKQ